jgi:Spy/CpxP family protein refolding chaperone
MNRLIIGFIVVAALIAGANAQTASPYAGQQQRTIKALSDRDIKDLLEARGMGLAKAAELNSYPGPLHVLQLAKELALSDAQRATTEALYTAMRNKAQPIGQRIIEAERILDRAFASGRIDAAMLQDQVNAIAALQGELRIVHLETHLTQRALLTSEQIARYDALRGYGDNGSRQLHEHTGGSPAGHQALQHR